MVDSIIINKKIEGQRGYVIYPSDSGIKLKFNFSCVCLRNLHSPQTHQCLFWKDLNIPVQRQGRLIKGMIHAILTGEDP